MKVGAIIICLLVGILLGLGLHTLFSGEKLLPLNVFEKREGGYELINPLLECETAESLENKELFSFKQEYNSYIQERLKRGLASHISVYFRDLNNGPWIGVEEKENFAPGSLLKVPLMMAYFKLAEENPEILQQKLKFEGLEDLNQKQNIKPSKSLEPGNSYTVEELVTYMIKYSENNAFTLLQQNIDETTFQKIYQALGLEVPGVRTAEDFISVKNYTAFFRVLFNASFLTRPMSEKALKFLTETDFKEGLVAEIPSETLVAHKFGERVNTLTGETQLHDCGIIYYPNHPYLLCVMSRGNNLKNLLEVIRDISSITYKEVDRQIKR